MNEKVKKVASTFRKIAENLEVNNVIGINGSYVDLVNNVEITYTIKSPYK